MFRASVCSVREGCRKELLVEGARDYMLLPWSSDVLLTGFVFNKTDTHNSARKKSNSVVVVAFVVACCLSCLLL